MKLLHKKSDTTGSNPVPYGPCPKREMDSSAILGGQFELLNSIGQGASGKVFKARQRNIDRVVAIKLLSPELIANAKSLKEFQSEARTTSSLDHPNIVKVYSLGLSLDERPYLVMDYLEGKTLSTILAEEPFIDLFRYLSIFLQVSAALAHAHSLGIVHGDVKPSNIMITKQSYGTELVKLLDFGMASLQTQSETATGKVTGTPAYMSPEQCRGMALDCRSDIYSLACVMYQALTGSPPFVGNNVVDTLLKHMHDEPPALSKMANAVFVPPPLAKLVHKCLSKSVKERPQSVVEVSTILEKLLDKVSCEGKVDPSQVWPTWPSVIRRRLFMAATICSAAILLVAALIPGSKNKKTKTKSSTQLSGIGIGTEQPSSNMSVRMLIRRADQELAQGNNSLAAAFYKMALQKIEQGKIDSGHRSKLAQNRILYSISMALAKATSQSESAWRQAIMFGKDAYGEKSYQVTEAQYQLAIYLADHGKTVEAEQLCKKTIATRIMLLNGEENTRVACLYSLLGVISEKNSRFEDAIKMQTKALRLWRATSESPDDEGILWSLFRLGCHQQKAKQYAQSERSFRELQDRTCTAPDVPIEDRHQIMQALINFYELEGQKQKAQQVCPMYVRCCEKFYATSPDDLAQACFTAAATYSHDDNAERALYFAGKCKQNLMACTQTVRTRLSRDVASIYQKLGYNNECQSCLRLARSDN